jgi:hypothetical protein
MTASPTDLDFSGHVVLVDVDQEVIRAAPGSEVHVKRTPLRVFSPWAPAQIEQLDPSPK